MLLSNLLFVKQNTYLIYRSLRQLTKAPHYSYNKHMGKKIKYKSNNYYTSPLPEESLDRFSKFSTKICLIALTHFVVALALWCIFGGKCFAVIEFSYELQLLSVVLCVLSIVGMIICAILGRNAYKLQKKVMQDDAPWLGFEKMSYNGQFITAVLVSAFTAFLFIIFCYYTIVTTFGIVDYGTGFDTFGLLMLLCCLLGSVFIWLYYAHNFKLNRLMQFVKIDPDKPKTEKPQKRRSAFWLSDEEIEEAKKQNVWADGSDGLGVDTENQVDSDTGNTDTQVDSDTDTENKD